MEIQFALDSSIRADSVFQKCPLHFITTKISYKFDTNETQNRNYIEQNKELSVRSSSFDRYSVEFALINIFWGMNIN